MQFYAMKPITVTSYDTEFTSSWTVTMKNSKMHNNDKQVLKMTIMIGLKWTPDSFALKMLCFKCQLI